MAKKKQIWAMKYQVGTSAFLLNFRAFSCFSWLKKLFGRGLSNTIMSRPFRVLLMVGILTQGVAAAWRPCLPWAGMSRPFGVNSGTVSVRVHTENLFTKTRKFAIVVRISLCFFVSFVIEKSFLSMASETALKSAKFT